MFTKLEMKAGHRICTTIEPWSQSKPLTTYTPAVTPQGSPPVGLGCSCSILYHCMPRPAASCLLEPSVLVGKGCESFLNCFYDLKWRVGTKRLWLCRIILFKATEYRGIHSTSPRINLPKTYCVTSLHFGRPIDANVYPRIKKMSTEYITFRIFSFSITWIAHFEYQLIYIVPLETIKLQTT